MKNGNGSWTMVSVYGVCGALFSAMWFLFFIAVGALTFMAFGKVHMTSNEAFVLAEPAAAILACLMALAGAYFIRDSDGRLAWCVMLNGDVAFVREGEETYKRASQALELGFRVMSK